MPHEEEVLGKAYDARLMRRLLTYLRPYSRQVALAFGAIVAASVLQLGQPYLVKVAIDRYIARGDAAGLDLVAAAFFAILLGSFALEFLQTYVLQVVGQRIMYDIRVQVHGHLQALDLSFYDRNPVGRLMTRVTTDVDVLNDLFASGVITVFGDVFTLAGIMIVLLVMDWRLALVAFSVLPLIVVITQWFRKHVRDSYRTVRTWIARINAFLQENIGGMATVQLFGREGSQFRRFDEIDRRHRDANLDSIFYYAVVRRRAGAGGGPHARLARRLHPVLPALLPADQRHLGEVQPVAGRDGLVGADLRAAGHEGADPGSR
jgi:ATP-binding cassette subfamily B protein